MKVLIGFLLTALPIQIYAAPIDSSKVNELKIAQAMRKAVRQADSTLLKTTTLADWRDYVKIATMELEPELRPLVLIKFDEDISFRHQIKKLIEWERDWEKKETEYYIYTYRWDQPLPDLILDIQEIHFRQITQLFGITASEKIPYRYDLTATETVVFPFEDLRAGIISPHPFVLEEAARAIFNFISTEPPCLIAPLVRIYGSYFQNASTSEAYYEKCLGDVKSRGYISALNLYPQREFNNSKPKEWASSYAFVFELNRQFGPRKLADFLRLVNCDVSEVEFQDAFENTFGVNLADFESQLIALTRKEQKRGKK